MGNFLSRKQAELDRERHLIQAFRWLPWDHAKLRLEIIQGLPERAKNWRPWQGQTLLPCGTTTNNNWNCLVSWLRCWARCQIKLFSTRLEGPGHTPCGPMCLQQLFPPVSSLPLPIHVYSLQMPWAVQKTVYKIQETLVGCWPCQM